jgi:hypothetical protein
MTRELLIRILTGLQFVITAAIQLAKLGRVALFRGLNRFLR